ncbi:MAG: hypothetical protein R2724_34680 [Bryobacterales bacterium]
MLALYLAALCFGGIPLAVSLLLGGADKDFDKDLGGGDVDHDAGPDLDHDVDGDVDHDLDGDVDHDLDGQADADGGDADHAHEGAMSGEFSLWWLTSMRFWTFGLTAFGLTGTLLTLLSVSAPLAAVVAVVLGLFSGNVAARFFRALARDEVSGDTELGRYVGEEAKVLVGIRPGEQGKIVVSTLAGRVELLATTRDAEPIAVGNKVIVAEVRNGVADVSALPAAGSGEAERLRQRKAARRQQDRV